MLSHKRLAWTIAMLATVAGIGAVATPAAAQTIAASAGAPVVQLNTGRGRLIQLDTAMSDVFVANETVADVQVRSPTQLYVFGKGPGETTLSVVNKAGRVIYSATIRVGNNIDSIDSMLRLAMPEAEVTATPMNGLVLLTGTVASPGDAAEAERLVQAFVGDQTKIVSRLRTATPLQVMLQVRFAEVSRSFLKNVGVNLMTRDNGSGISFGVGSGTRTNFGTIGKVDTSGLPVLDASSKFGFPPGTISLPFDPARGDFVYPGSVANTFTKSPNHFSTLGIAGRLLGLDVLSAIDLGERIGQVTTLATPNLTALSGETATFLAGGEIPIPISQGLGAVSVEYKQYGVSLAFTPTVMSDGRISLRVRPEVSQLSEAGAVTIGSTSIPALTTRRTETSIELGSGESMMIAGLVQNTHNNVIDKAPGLGDVPVLGALFRSNAFQRNETELVIVITPYLVKPVNGSDIRLPTDGYQAPNDFDRIFGGQLTGSSANPERPKPTMTAPAGAIGSTGLPPAPGASVPQQALAAPPAPAQPAPGEERRRSGKSRTAAAAAPGFSQ
ncbi:secretion system protein [Nostoc sp. 3335mG]|nr:secretion system protein [Nostoc sp. 3335mG]